MYQPQLIVGYDTQDEHADLIHISKAEQGKDYYCPCCGGVIRARCKESNSVQEHYYHLNKTCDKESQIHWMYKHFLFEEGSSFKVADCIYKVKNIEIEKHYSTSIGEYIPDITVYTQEGKTIFFELFFTNKKDENYVYKWQELDIDVVEVNLKELMTKADIGTPTFEYLYHDGQFYKKEYHKKNLYASTIGTRKEEIRMNRQDYMDYKTHWQKLDWFYQTIQDVLHNNQNEDILIDHFTALDLEDMYCCYENVKRTNCVKHLKAQLGEIINNKVIEYINNLILPLKELEMTVQLSDNGLRKKFLSIRWGCLGKNFLNVEVSYQYTFVFKSNVYNIKDIENEINRLKVKISEIKDEIETKKYIVQNLSNILKKETGYDCFVFTLNTTKLGMGIYLDKYDAFMNFKGNLVKYPTNYLPSNSLEINIPICKDLSETNKFISKILDKYEIQYNVKNCLEYADLLSWFNDYSKDIESKISYKIAEKIQNIDEILGSGTTCNEYKTFFPVVCVRAYGPSICKHSFRIIVSIAREQIYEKEISEDICLKKDIDSILKEIDFNTIQNTANKILENANLLLPYAKKINDCANGYYAASIEFSYDIKDALLHTKLCIKNTDAFYSNLNGTPQYYIDTLFTKTRNIIYPMQECIEYSDHIESDIYKALKNIRYKIEEKYGYGFATEEEIKQNEQKRTK